MAQRVVLGSRRNVWCTAIGDGLNNITLASSNKSAARITRIAAGLFASVTQARHNANGLLRRTISRCASCGGGARIKQNISFPQHTALTYTAPLLLHTTRCAARSAAASCRLASAHRGFHGSPQHSLRFFLTHSFCTAPRHQHSLTPRSRASRINISRLAWKGRRQGGRDGKKDRQRLAQLSGNPSGCIILDSRRSDISG